jgi:2-hydroxy fatty acid dioxygenase
MTLLGDRMAGYAAYHLHPVNRGLHAVGIPAIVWSFMLLAGLLTLWRGSGLEVTLAHVLAVVLLVWYLRLDYIMGVVSAAIFAVFLVTSHQVGEALGTMGAVWLGLGIQAVGWGAQFLGHGVWEKRRPALLDNAVQAFVAPVFIFTEGLFVLGVRKGLRDEVEGKARALRAKAEAQPR